MMREYRIGTVSLRQTDDVVDPERRIKDRQERFDEVEPFIQEAGRLAVDFLCLPECFSTHGTTIPSEELAEPVPEGPSSRFCSRLARENNLNLIATIYRKLNGLVYNAAVIFDRKGNLTGTYHKVHPAPGENVTAGNEFPVISVDGVKIGFQICFDLNYPEGCRVLALKDAEIIFWPTMWTGPTEHFIDCVMRTRAMENFVTLVASAYVYYEPVDYRSRISLAPAAIISWDGSILAQTGSRTGLATALVDLDEPKLLQGDRETVFRNRRPALYGELVRV